MSVAVVTSGSSTSDDHWRFTEQRVDGVAAAAEDGDLVFLLEAPSTADVIVGHGAVLQIRGACAHRSSRVQTVRAWLDDRPVQLSCGEIRDEFFPTFAEQGFPRPGLTGFNGHMLLSPGESLSNGKNDVTLRFQIDCENGAQLEVPSTELRLVAHADIVTPSIVEPAGEGAPIAIVMAAYRPQLAAFERQINSIRAQTHARWHLVIRDDGSDAERYDQMQNLVADDDRITLIRNEHNLGFYRNFEAGLCSVPGWAEYVALADQDDYWYPEKLASLLAAMPAKGALVYSDMRIVDSAGEEISPTYWRGRRNNYEDLDVVLLANTVTGAASLVRYDLLDALLPFPDRIGDAFHDHWIALSAMVRGPVGYVDRPLYDYVQHDSAVIGHSDFDTPSVSVRVRRTAGAPFRRAFWSNVRNKLVSIRRGALNIHRYECRRLEAIAQTLVLRCPGMSSKHHRALALFSGGVSSAMKLFLKHPGIAVRGASTNDAEMRLGMGYLVHSIEPLRLSVLSWLPGARKASA